MNKDHIFNSHMNPAMEVDHSYIIDFNLSPFRTIFFLNKNKTI